MEIIKYVIFGGLTTVVNFLAYFACIDLLDFNYLVANIISWFLSVIFAYITNRAFVFEKVNFTFRSILKEVSLFFGSRFLSGAIETASLFLLVELMHLDDHISKIAVAVIVVILNYVFSKLIVFRRKK